MTDLWESDHALACHVCLGTYEDWWVMRLRVQQGLLQKVQQVVTLCILDGKLDPKLQTALDFMKILFDANLKARLVPISAFYNDAGVWHVQDDMHISLCLLHAQVYMHDDNQRIILTACALHQQIMDMCLLENALLLPSMMCLLATILIR